MKDHMKGNLLNVAVPAVGMLIFVGIILGAGAIALNGMNTGDTNQSHAFNLWVASAALQNSSDGVLNLSTQLPTVGTIIGVGLIIVVLFLAVGAYVFGRK